MSLPTHHKTAVWVRDEEHKFHFQIEDAPLPVPGPQEVLVRLTCTGVCGSDIALASGELGPCCKVLGHEGVGRVISLGSGISDTQVKIGTRVGVAWQRDVCGTCELCLLPDGETRCLLQMTGRKVDGTFAEYTIVPYRYLTPVTEEVEDQLIAPILCGGVTIYKGLKICGATPGQWVVISGAGGGVGSLGIQYAKAMGYRVIAIDAGKEKEEYCKQLGAEVYVDVTNGQDTIATVREKSGGYGAAAVLVTAGSGKAYQDAISMLGGFGTLVCIGIPPPSQTVTFHPITFIDLGIRIVGSAVGTRLDIREALAFVQRGLVMPKVHMAKLEDLSEIVEQITSGKAIGKFVVRFRPGAREGSPTN
ncbi:zinc-binding dehydrogenase [Acephala macrosclerotiorum]|nr:zinc-binding dehydrogenase [Acephala macrosclerotiorum]